jgi:hypothetical protein
VRRFLPLVIVAAVACLSACGSTSTKAASSTATVPQTSSSAASATLTGAEFTTKVNSLCTAEGQAIGGIIGELHSSAEPTPDAMQKALDAIVNQSRGLAHDIGALGGPPESESNAAALVAALNAGTDQAEAQNGAAFFANDGDPWSSAGALAQQYGFTACSPTQG